MHNIFDNVTKDKSSWSDQQLTTVEPIATPAAVEAICPNSPGCCGVAGVGWATFDAGLAAGTLDEGLGEARGAGGGALPNVGDERPLDRLPPRGIIIIFVRIQKFYNFTNSKLCKAVRVKKNGVRLWCKLAFYWLIVTLRFNAFPDVVAGFASYPISARTKFSKEKGK